MECTYGWIWDSEKEPQDKQYLVIVRHVHVSVPCSQLDMFHVRHSQLDMYMSVYPVSYESLICYPLQLVNGQCFLSIGLIQFQNLYSLEIRPDWANGPFCCCDGATCQSNANQFTLDTCEYFCDAYFVLSFSECQDLLSCSVTKTTDTSLDSATTTDVNYDFHFIIGSSAVEQVQSDYIYM